MHGTKTHGLLKPSGASYAVQPPSPIWTGGEQLRERLSLAHPARAQCPGPGSWRGLMHGGLQSIISLGQSFLNGLKAQWSEGAKREELICSWPWKQHPFFHSAIRVSSGPLPNPGLGTCVPCLEGRPQVEGLAPPPFKFPPKRRLLSAPPPTPSLQSVLRWPPPTTRGFTFHGFVTCKSTTGQKY